MTINKQTTPTVVSEQELTSACLSFLAYLPQFHEAQMVMVKERI